MGDSDEIIVKTHVVKDDTKVTPKPPNKNVKATFSTVTVGGSGAANPGPQPLLRLATNRRRALIQVTAAGPVSFGVSSSDAQAQGNGTATVASAAAGWFELYTTREVWVYSAQSGVSTIACIQEFDEE